MRQNPAPPQHQEKNVPAVDPDIRFATLLYRFLFFDWLFTDMNKAMDLYERHSAWQHNRRMRRYLPIYLWRWSVLTALAFGLGCLFEQRLGTTLVAAWFFTWSCVTLTGMLVISVLWVFLSNSQTS